MRYKQFFSIALSGLLLAALSCHTRSRVKSVFVDPTVGAYSYAAPGDTLEFRAFNSKSTPFYVIFEDPSPCAETYLKVTQDKPGTCKVTARSGIFQFLVSNSPPNPHSRPHGCGGCQILGPCLACKIVIAPNPGQPIGLVPSTPIPSPSQVPEINGRGERTH